MQSEKWSQKNKKGIPLARNPAGFIQNPPHEFSTAKYAEYTKVFRGEVRIFRVFSVFRGSLGFLHRRAF
jgi:hypothetical protein